jgi:hypothetical protein
MARSQQWSPSQRRIGKRMPVPQQLVIDTIRARCEELDERYPGYRREVIGYLAEILTIERAAPKNVVQQVEGQLEAFGDLFHRRGKEDRAER